MAKAKIKELESPAVFMRGAKEFRHDLFKSDVQKMKRNVSFKKGVVQIVELEHAHVYHSHNSQGRIQEFTSTVGGHFHKVERGFKPDGSPFVKCGPAMREVFKKKSNGQRRVKEPVRWHDNDEESFIVDGHSHTFEYEGSEMLSDRKVKAIQSQTQAAVSAALPDPHGQQVTQETDAGDDDVSLEDASGDE